MAARKDSVRVRKDSVSVRKGSVRKGVPRQSMASRPGETGPRRWRRAVLLVTGLVCLGVTIAAAYLASRSASQSPQFRVAALEVRGLRLLQGEEVLQASGVQVGAGLFAVDLDAVAERLEDLVWVRSVRVERKPPDRLIVHLEERRRVAWVQWKGQLLGVDRDGVLLPAERLGAEGVEDLDLPVLRTANLAATGDTVGVGRAVSDSTALRLLTWWGAAVIQAPDLAREISEIGAYDDAALRLRLVADDLEVRVPDHHVGERLATLREVLKRVYRECPNPTYVDLRFEGQAVIGTVAASMPPPPGAASPSVRVEERLGHG